MIRSVLLACLVSGATQAQGLGDIGGLQALKSAFAGPSCSQVNTAQICRLLPWTPHMKEGVWLIGSTGLIVFSRAHASREFLAVVDKFAKGHAGPFTALHLLLGTSLATAVGSGAFPTLGVMEIEHRVGQVKPLWIYVAPVLGLQNFLLQYRQLLPKILESEGEWSPPEELAFPGSFAEL